MSMGHSVKSGQILSRYVKKNVLFAMLFAIIGLWALQAIFSYLSEMDNLSDSYNYFEALRYIFYRSPDFLEQFIPTGALLGAVIGLGLLANNSELIVMRASGMSIYRIVLWALQPAIIFVVIALAINQYVLPNTNLKANQIRKPDTAALASVNGYWTLQQQNKANGIEGNNILFIDYADANGNIGQVKRWHLDNDYNLTSVSKAQNGTYISNSKRPVDAQNPSSNPDAQTVGIDAESEQYQWQLNNVVTLSLADRAAINKSDSVSTEQKDASSDKALSARQKNQALSSNIIQNNEPLVYQQTESSDVISLPISPSSVYLLTRSAENLSLSQLYEHKRFNDAQGTRSLEHELAFWQKLLSPFSIFSLVIMACSFVFGSLRTHSLGLRIVVAIIFGLLFSYLQELVGYVSLATGASPLFMVLIPIIGSAALGFYLLKRQG